VRRELEGCPLSREEWTRRLGDAALAPGAGERAAVPLTCKMRLCWSTADYEAGRACSPGLARALAEEGVSAVTVHGRTTEDKFAGTVRRDGIARVVEAVGGRVPVIGNGDVREAEDAAAMRRETGCDGVMIGRGALSTPWIFREAAALLAGARVPAPPAEREILAMIARYVGLMRAQRDERYALFQIQRRISWFAKRMQRPLANGKMESVKPFKEAVRTARSTGDVLAALEAFGVGGLRGGVDEPQELPA
jgi:tRNA-dihydrouridine synthase